MKNFKLTAIVLGIVALAGFAAAQSADAKPFLGDWKGTISIMGVDLEIGLHFKLDEAKKVTGTFDSISQGAMGLPLGAVEIKGKDATFTLSGVPGDPTFKGALDATGKKLSGEFTQGGAAGTFAVDKQ
ncbi:MAG: hypothetical protein MUE80_04200 [Acidobacteria bacterium]|jgi:hypothetical protein|nr:hypothetical protein [Acidobacteriota bacterium]